jgi:predicted HTH transcriptional regulator
VGDEAVPTFAGILLFGRDERVANLLPRTMVTLRRYAGDSIQSPEIESIRLGGNLLTLYESSLKFIERYCDLWDMRPKGIQDAKQGESPIEARSNYQRGAVSEAIANLLVHRDLSVRDLQTRINVFDHSIEFVNPRRSSGFSPQAQKAIRYGIPQRLNPQVTAIFNSPAYGVALPGGGLPALLKRARLFAGRRAEIHAFNDEFRLRIYGV